MEFMDLFRPKWRHSEANVRLAAVRMLTDQNILAQVAKTADFDDVRIAAVEELNDESVLTEFAGADRNWDVRLAAVRKLTDQGSLAIVAKFQSAVHVSLAAVNKLTDQHKSGSAGGGERLDELCGSRRRHRGGWRTPGYCRCSRPAGPRLCPELVWRIKE